MSSDVDGDALEDLIENLERPPIEISPEMRSRIEKAFPQYHEERVNVPGVDRAATYYLDPELIYRVTSIDVRGPASGCCVEFIRVGEQDQLVRSVPAEAFERKHDRHHRIDMQTVKPPARIRIKLSAGCKELVVYGFRELRPSVKFGIEDG